MLLFLNSISHFFVDGLCIATLFGEISLEGDISVAVLLYNTLAFSTQCIVGLVTDETGRWEWLCFASMLAVVMGFILPVPWYIKVALIGLGNSLFHVTGGSMTLRDSGEKAAKLGVFVAPGAFGVTMGTLWPEMGILFAAGLTICAAAMFVAAFRFKSYNKINASIHTEAKLRLDVIILLTAAVAVRAVGGSAVSFPWKNGAVISMIMTAFVFGGKAVGGHICDRIGARNLSLISIPICAVMIAFFSAWEIPSLIGQFLLNLSMPVTLYLMYRSMPSSPGFAFGLAASALWPGTIAGSLFKLTGPALWICVAGSFMFGLFAIIYSDSKIRRINNEKVC